MKVLMCRPDYYGIEYEINPWMSLTHRVDQTGAKKQWETLYQTIAKCDAEILLVPPVPGWPDMVFTANAGLVYQNKFLLSHFKFKERQGEEKYFEDWFKHHRFEKIEANNTEFFEGAGDALYAGDILFVGYGFRSDQPFYKKTSFFNQDKLVYCELVNPYFYHLDTCFCPLNENLAIWYPDAFSEDSQKRMAEKITLIDVNIEEAKRFACNAVVLGKHVIVPTECPKITADLEKHGFTVHACNMDEFLKAGGACKCLTLRLT
jgi:N-dimethylarginine dimethylaminohydrolase